MAIDRALNLSRLVVPVAATLATLAPMLIANDAKAATIVVTPGEQNTQSGENGCAAEPCPGGHWLHYPELLQVALGADYTVQNNGDGGAVLGCDATTMAAAGGNSFCASGKYTTSIATPPGIVIIGPFGEHDQRIVANNAALYDQTVFESAYEGLVQKYLQYTQQIYIMTPIDVPWGGTPTLPNGEDLVKDVMLPAALKVANDHHLTVIDTYTEISGTADLVTQYYGNDGQVTSAGQQKMADLILAALAGGTGGSGNVDAGSGGASEAGAGGAGGVAEGGAETGGTVSMAGSGGAGESTGGSESAAGGDAAGGSATSGGAAGESATGTAGAAGTTKKHHSSGCALSTENDRSSGSSLSLLSILGLAAFARKRRSVK